MKAAIKGKCEMHTWYKANYQGNMFSLTLQDQSGSIKATAFKEDADHLYKELQVGNTYIITHGSIKPTNKRYDSSGHEYEITFDRDTTVEITSCKDGRLVVPCAHCNVSGLREA
jgi:replication factor A1